MLKNQIGEDQIPIFLEKSFKIFGTWQRMCQELIVDNYVGKMDENNKMRASRGGLIRALCIPNEKFMRQFEYAHILLLVYRWFMDDFQMLKFIKQELLLISFLKLDEMEVKKRRLRYANFLKQFILGNDNLVPLQNIIREMLAFYQDPIRKMLLSTLSAQLENKCESRYISYPVPPPILEPKSPFTGVLDLNPVEMARQLTILTWEKFRSINLSELLNLNWKKENTEQTCPNLMAFIKFSSSLSDYVKRTIQNVENPKELVRYWFKVGDHLVKLNNLHCTRFLLYALDQEEFVAPIEDENTRALEQLRNVFSTSKQYTALRLVQQMTTLPCIPFVSLILTDLEFIGDSIYDDGLIKFDTLQCVGSVIQEFRYYQKMPYNLAAIPLVQDFLHFQIEQNL